MLGRGSNPTTPTTILILLAAAWIAGCSSTPDHYLVHPREPAPDVVTWEENFVRDPLVIHVRGARRENRGRSPVAIVHPEGGKTADEMQGILWAPRCAGLRDVTRLPGTPDLAHERRIDDQVPERPDQHHVDLT